MHRITNSQMCDIARRAGGRHLRWVTQTNKEVQKQAEQDRELA